MVAAPSSTPCVIFGQVISFLQTSVSISIKWEYDLAQWVLLPSDCVQRRAQHSIRITQTSHPGDTLSPPRSGLRPITTIATRSRSHRLLFSVFPRPTPTGPSRLYLQSLSRKLSLVVPGWIPALPLSSHYPHPSPMLNSIVVLITSHLSYA